MVTGSSLAPRLSAPSVTVCTTVRPVRVSAGLAGIRMVASAAIEVRWFACPLHDPPPSGAGCDFRRVCARARRSVGSLRRPARRADARTAASARAATARVIVQADLRRSRPRARGGRRRAGPDRPADRRRCRRRRARERSSALLSRRPGVRAVTPDAQDERPGLDRRASAHRRPTSAESVYPKVVRADQVADAGRRPATASRVAVLDTGINETADLRRPDQADRRTRWRRPAVRQPVGRAHLRRRLRPRHVPGRDHRRRRHRVERQVRRRRAGGRARLDQGRLRATVPPTSATCSPASSGRCRSRTSTTSACSTSRSARTRPSPGGSTR